MTMKRFKTIEWESGCQTTLKGRILNIHGGEYFDTDTWAHTHKRITGLFGNFFQHGRGVFPISKTKNKVPLNHPKISQKTY